MSRTTLVAVAAAATALLACAPSRADGIPRAWVSGHGTDAAGCGAPTNPCRSLQYALDDIVADGGEIDILDPAGYGSVAIGKSVSIVNDGVGTAGVQQGVTGDDAIKIQAASSDAVTLRGLDIDGLGVAANGIHLLSAGALTVQNCVIRHFAHDGAYLQEQNNKLELTVFNTFAADNANDGFDISPQPGGSILGVIDHSGATTNGGDGIALWGLNTTSGSVVAITIANSDTSNNGTAGIYAKGLTASNAYAQVREDVSDFDTYGYYADAGSFMGYLAFRGAVRLHRQPAHRLPRLRDHVRRQRSAVRGRQSQDGLEPVRLRCRHARWQNEEDRRSLARQGWCPARSLWSSWRPWR
jgi:hypothetical protein